MPSAAATVPTGKQEPAVKLVFYSPDEQRAWRVTARLRQLASVQWEDLRRFSNERWAELRESHALVLLDFAAPHAAMSAQLVKDLHALSPETALLGVGSSNEDHGSSVLAAMRAGLRDFVDLDASDDELRKLLERALAHAAQPQLPGSSSAPVKTGKLVVLLGVRPGVGTSTLAAHLGAMSMPRRSLADHGNDMPPSLLLDLGSPIGDAALYLNAKSEFFFEDALKHAARIDPTMVRTALPQHPASRLPVLSARSVLPLVQETTEAEALTERLRRLFSLVLCDVGGLPVAQVPLPMLRLADEIWLISDQGLGSMVSLDQCLHELERLKLRERRISLVLNRYDDDAGMNAAQISRRFDLPLLATLPERARVLRASANQGQLLDEAAPHDAYVRALAPLQARLNPGASAPVSLTPWQRLLQRWGIGRWAKR